MLVLEEDWRCDHHFVDNPGSMGGGLNAHALFTANPCMIQVMGMMQGKAVGDTFIVVDSFALPVEGTETRVNAAEGAYEFLATYPETAKVRFCGSQYGLDQGERPCCHVVVHSLAQFSFNLMHLKAIGQDPGFAICLPSC